MVQFTYTIASISVLVTLYQLFSNFAKCYLFITDIQWYLVVGTVIRFTLWSPFDNVSERTQSMVVVEITKYIIAIQLMASALRLPPQWFKSHLLIILYLIILVLPLSILLSYLFGWLIFPTIPPFVLLAISSCLGPTDPVITSSLVQGSFSEKHIRASLRFLLLAESGINDGSGHPLMYIPILLMNRIPFYEWTYKVILFQTVLAIVSGIVLGFVFGHAIDWTHTRQLSDKDTYIVTIIPVTILIASSIDSFGGDGIFAVFMAGIVIDALDSEPERRDEQRTMDIIDYLVGIVFAFVFAFIIPWTSFAKYNIGKLTLFAILVLTLRRLFFVLPLLKMRFFDNIFTVPRWIDAIGLSFFAPVAVAAIHYACEIHLQTGEKCPFEIVSFVALCSIVLHGSTSIIWYGYLQDRLVTI
jgi:sodium/hydrogen antiporter